MSKWGFSASDGRQPNPEADSVASKRNVVATNLGWVRRQTYVDTQGSSRFKEEVIVAANPGDGSVGGYNSASHLNQPDVTQIYVDVAASKIYAVLNASVTYSSGDITMVIDDTATASTFTATFTGTLVNADNTLEFNMPVMADGVYEVAAQTLGASGSPVGDVDLAVSAEVAAGLSNAAGQQTSTFEIVSTRAATKKSAKTPAKEVKPPVEEVVEEEDI